jgi:hypothetical protein
MKLLRILKFALAVLLTAAIAAPLAMAKKKEARKT